MGKSPIIVGHGGSSEGVTPNTIGAFKKAIGAGVEMVEVDIHRAKDDVMVASHEPHFEGALIKNLYSHQIAATHNEISLVEEFVRLAGKHPIKIMFDLKEPGYEADFVKLVLKYLQPSQFVVSSLEDESVKVINDMGLGINVGLSLGRHKPENKFRTRLSEVFPIKRAKRCGAKFLSANYKLVRLGILRRARRANLPVYVWTIDDQDHIIRVLKDKRVEGLITNRPVLAVRLKQGLEGN